MIEQGRPQTSGVIRIVDLEGLCAQLAETVPRLSEVWLFGSRRHATRSRRSDIDVLLRTEDDRLIQYATLARIREAEPYLDCFSVSLGVATSIANESQITAPTWDELRGELDAIQIWGSGKWMGQDDVKQHEVLSQHNPVLTLAALGQLRDPLRDQYDSLVLCALREEYEACLSVFGPTENAQSNSCVAKLTADGQRDIFVRLVCIGRKGSIESAIAAANWLTRSPASNVVLVGLTAGVEPLVKLGDVIVPSAVYDYEPAKATAGGRKPEMTVYNADRSLHAIAGALAGAFQPSDAARALWPQSETSAVDKPISVHTDALMASGAKVVADAKFAAEVTGWNRKAAGIEMESAGIAAAALAFDQPKVFLVVKGVSDLADADKADDWRPFASRAAAEFARDVVEAAARRGRGG